MTTVRNIGERGLLNKLQSFCPPNVVGDDGAVLSVESDKSLVVTTDVLVDGVHFSDRTTAPYDVGWRAAAANLSDLAAMGAEPLGITVGLSLPEDLAVSWVEELYRGIYDCLQKYQTSIVGGDICRSQVISVAITAMGQVLPERVIRRRNARPGDAILITGLHGLSKAGLELLLDRSLGDNLTSTEKEKLIIAHQRPQPRLDVLPWLAENASDIAIAGMDSSDGLADAIVQICQCSEVGANIDIHCLEIYPALHKLAGKEKALHWLLYGGEDFELVLCLPQAIALAAIDYLGQNSAIIGTIVSEKRAVLIDRLNSTNTKILELAEGFQHFA